VGLDAANRAAGALESRLRALKTAADPLGDSFAKLGIKSQRMLDDAADSARNSFNAIVQGARSGQASINDVRAAFQAYARVQMETVANAEPWKQAQVRSALEVQATTLNVTDSIDKMGLSGIDAGANVAKGAHEGADAMDRLAASTQKAAAAGEKLGSSGMDSDGKPKWHDIINNTRVALNGLSDAMLRQLSNLNALASSPRLWADQWNKVFADWQHQKDEYTEQLGVIEKQNAAYDEMTQRVAKLRTQYRYLNDDALRNMAMAQKTLEDNQKRAAEEAKAKHDEAVRKAKELYDAQNAAWRKEMGLDEKGQPAAAAPAAKPERIAIDLTVAASQTSGAVPAQLSGTDVQKVANEVVRQISIARSRSNR